MNPEVIKHLTSMRHSPLTNYIVPGLTSWMILDRGEHGKIRMFENAREQHHFITPHSHRFNFSACVLKGVVRNTTWFQCDKGNGDTYRRTKKTYLGVPGRFQSDLDSDTQFLTDTLTYSEGDWYNMQFHEIHSIEFSKGAAVLFIEGPSVVNHSYVLEPIVDGEYLPTMKTEPWMFQKPKEIAK